MVKTTALKYIRQGYYHLPPLAPHPATPKESIWPDNDLRRMIMQSIYFDDAGPITGLQ